MGVCMLYLRWLDTKGNCTAYAAAAGEIQVMLNCQVGELRGRLFPVRKWAYNHMVSPLISAAVPLNAILPQYKLEINGEPQEGMSFLIPGHPLLPTMGETAYARSAIIHSRILPGSGVDLLSLQMAFPPVLQAHKQRVQELWDLVEKGEGYEDPSVE